VGFYGSVKLVNELRQTVDMIRVLMGNEEHVGSLDLISETLYSFLLTRSRLLNGGDEEEYETVALSEGIKMVHYESSIPRLDLRGMKSLSGVAEELNEIVEVIGSDMGADFLGIIGAELDALAECLTSEKSDGNLPFEGSLASRWAGNILESRFSFLEMFVSSPVDGSFPREFVNESTGWNEMGARLRGSLRPIVLGLLRMDRLGSAMGAYKDAVMGRVRHFSKEGVLDSPRDTSTYDYLLNYRPLTFEAFMRMMVMVYMNFLYVIQYSALVNEVIEGILEDAKRDEVFDSMMDLHSPGPRVARVDEVGDEDSSLRSSTVSMDRKSASVGRRDSFSGGRTLVDEMTIESAHIVNSVADLCYAKCSKLIVSRGDQNSRLNPGEFYRLFGSTWEFVCGCEHIAGYAGLGLKSTMLGQAKSFLSFFHDEKSKQLAMLIENEQWTQAVVPNDFQQIVEIILNAADAPISATQFDLATRVSRDLARGERNEGKVLMVKDERFYTVGCLLLFLKMLTEYMKCMDNIPGLITECLNRILEILKVCFLILYNT
jgi:hypothetical protein